jgi:hypothetical protein
MDLRLKTEPEIKIETSKTIINEVIVDTEEIVEETKSCFTKISLFLKKMIYCQCQSSSNCIKKHEPENKK